MIEKIETIELDPGEYVINGSLKKVLHKFKVQVAPDTLGYKKKEEKKWMPIPAYDGDDMTGFMLDKGFKLSDMTEKIKSITNVRSTAIIVTEKSVFIAEPCHDVGFCVKMLCYIPW